MFPPDTYGVGVTVERLPGVRWEDDIALPAGVVSRPSRLGEVLREAAAELPSVTLLIGWRATSVVDRPDGARAVIEDPEGTAHEISADYLLGCDGSSGISRTAIGARYEGSSSAWLRKVMDRLGTLPEEPS